MKYISLMTDFGLRDGYTGVMKGVIYRIAPDVQIADISHAISPQNVLEGCLVWGRSYAYFPAGTIHVGVVDPGVGTQRRPLAAKIGDYYFVCPDNGLLTIPLGEAEKAGKPVEIVHLDQPRYWLPQVSNVFHGRDIFSPVAAHLAAGVPLKDLGDPIRDPVRLDIPQPQAKQNGWQGEVILIDQFGNIATNLTPEHLSGRMDVQVQIGSQKIDGLVKTFGERKPGEWAAMIGSDNYLEIAIVNGNAAGEIHARVGDPVEVKFKAP